MSTTEEKIRISSWKSFAECATLIMFSANKLDDCVEPSLAMHRTIKANIKLWNFQQNQILFHTILFSFREMNSNSKYQSGDVKDEIVCHVQD